MILTSNPTRRPAIASSRLVSAIALGVLAHAVLPLVPIPRPLHAQSFQVEEATIADVHTAFLSGELTCVALVQAYLDRIEAYDHQGPG